MCVCGGVAGWADERTRGAAPNKKNGPDAGLQSWTSAPSRLGAFLPLAPRPVLCPPVPDLPRPRSTPSFTIVNVVLAFGRRVGGCGQTQRSEQRFFFFFFRRTNQCANNSTLQPSLSFSGKP